MRSLLYLILLGMSCLLIDSCAKNDDAASSSPLVQSKSDFPDTPLGAQVAKHVELLAAVGDDAEVNYQKSLIELRSELPEVIEIIYQAYMKMETTRYFKRWVLVETLRELQSDSILFVLERIAFSDIPDELWSDPENFSIDKESNIRVTAVDGIAELAKGKNVRAVEILKRLFNHEELSIRRRAIRGYLSIGNYKERADSLRNIISEKDYWLINLDITDPKKVPHPSIPVDISAAKVKKLETTPQIELKDK